MKNVVKISLFFIVMHVYSQPKELEHLSPDKFFKRLAVEVKKSFDAGINPKGGLIIKTKILSGMPFMDIQYEKLVCTVFLPELASFQNLQGYKWVQSVTKKDV